MVLMSHYEMHASTSIRLLTVLFKILKGKNCFKFLKGRLPDTKIFVGLCARASHEGKAGLVTDGKVSHATT